MGLIIKNDKIISATEDELFEHYLKKEYDDVFTFDEYLHKMKEAGVKIKNEAINIS